MLKCTAAHGYCLMLNPVYLLSLLLLKKNYSSGLHHNKVKHLFCKLHIDNGHAHKLTEQYYRKKDMLFAFVIFL